jgi:AP2 domain
MRRSCYNLSSAAKPHNSIRGGMMPKRRMWRAPVVQPRNKSIKRIALTKGQVATVSAQRYELLNQWNWCACWCEPTQSYYANRTMPLGDGKYYCMTMQRQIKGLKPGDPRQVDHKNHKTLDNRDSNLRIASRTMQRLNTRLSGRNTSGYKGVYWHRRAKNWVAEVRAYNYKFHLGSFDTPRKGYLARRRFIKERFPELLPLI